MTSLDLRHGPAAGERAADGLNPDCVSRDGDKAELCIANAEHLGHTDDLAVTVRPDHRCVRNGRLDVRRLGHSGSS